MRDNESALVFSLRRDIESKSEMLCHSAIGLNNMTTAVDNNSVNVSNTDIFV